MVNGWAVMKAIIIASVIAGLATPANASNWYILDGGKAECRNAAKISPLIASPYVFEQGLRSDGNFGDTKVYRGYNNRVTVVLIRTKKSTDPVAFFPTNKDCMDGLQIGLKQGLINNPNELK